MSHDLSRLARRAAARGIATTADAPPTATLTHHVLLCTGKKCGRKVSRRAFRRLRRRAAQLAKDGVRVHATEVACLRLSERGPIAVVYPDGTWYAEVTASVIDRICDEQLRHGHPVASHCFAHHPLPGGTTRPTPP